MADSVNEEPSVAPSISLGEVNLAYHSYQRKSLLKIAVLGIIVVAIILWLTSYFSQRDFIESIMKYKPFSSGELVADDLYAQAIEWKKATIVRDAYRSYVEQGEASVKSMQSMIDKINSGVIDPSLLVKSGWSYRYDTISGGQNSSDLFFLNLGYMDGDRTVSVDGAKTIVLNYNTPRISHNMSYDIQQFSSQMTESVPRSSVVDPTSKAQVVAALGKDGLVSLAQRFMLIHRQNIDSAAKSASDIDAFLINKDRSLKGVISRMYSTDSAFYFTIFSRVIGALSMLAVVGVSLRLLARELHFVNRINLAYFSFIYSESGTRSADYLRGVADVVRSADAGGVVPGDDDHKNIIIDIVNGLVRGIKK